MQWISSFHIFLYCFAKTYHFKLGHLINSIFNFIKPNLVILPLPAAGDGSVGALMYILSSL